MKMLTADRLKIGNLLIRKGTTHVAEKYGVSKKQVVAFRKKYLWNASPKGNKRDYLDRYFVYADGRVWSKHFFRFLRPTVMKFGYWMYNLEDGNMVLAHRLVLTVFKRLPKPGEEARHYHDPDPANNNLWNLKWGTSTQNNRDRTRHGTQNTGSHHGRAKLDEPTVRALRKKYRAGDRGVGVRYARKSGMNKHTVYKALIGQTWKHVQ